MKSGAAQRDDRERERADPHERMPDVGGGLAVDTRERRFDVLQIDARAHHPAPAFERNHIAELRRDQSCRWPPPHVADVAAAARRLPDELLNHQRPVRIAHQPQIAPDEIRLARMRQRRAVHCIDEEIAVPAEVEALQRLERKAPAFVVAARIVRGCVVVRGRSRSSRFPRNAGARFPCSTCTRPAWLRAAPARALRPAVARQR